MLQALGDTEEIEQVGRHRGDVHHLVVPTLPASSPRVTIRADAIWGLIVHGFAPPWWSRFVVVGWNLKFTKLPRRDQPGAAVAGTLLKMVLGQALAVR